MADVDQAVSKPKAPRRARAARSSDAELDSPDPVEIAMKAVAAGAVPGSAARVVLEKHAGLIDIQCKREREELGVLRVQRITRWLILLAVAALLLGAVFLIWNASRTETLVVEPFRVPPTLGNAGLSGEVMATQIMDHLATMQSRTLSTRPAESYSSDWGDDIDVAIPNMGATVGDLRRLLRSWFGKETRISGEALRLGDNWTVTARVTGHNAVTATGPELAPLVSQVAEGVYRQTQAYRYVIYLLGSGRRSEAQAAARELALNGPEEERPWGHVAFANALGGDIAERDRLPALRRAAQAVPDFPMPVGNYAAALERVGRWEEALAAHRRSAALVGDGSGISEEFRGQYLRRKNAYPARLVGDYLHAATQFELSSEVGSPTYSAGLISSAAGMRFYLHDVQGGNRLFERYLEMSGNNRGTNQVAALGFENLDETQKFDLLQSISIDAYRSIVLADNAVLARDLPRQIAVLQAILASFNPSISRDLGRGFWPDLAPPLARTGRVAEAEALLAPLEPDCYPCLVARGEVAAAKGDRAAARRWLSEAARQGPSLPFAHDALGRMLASSGDRAGALVAFAEAHRRGPRWAEPLKHRGDVLVEQQQWRDAERAYRLAADRAPRWGRLHMVWARALWRIGRQDQAREKLRAAAGMDLSAADRARVRIMMTRAGI